MINLVLVQAPTVRRLTAADEQAFQALLRAAYGETYSHRDLYAKGGVARLLATGARLWGEFDDAGNLLAHTGFAVRDPNGEYVESCLSIAHPQRARARSATAESQHWPNLLSTAGAPLIHQHTTTWHPLAQRYALQKMHAHFMGWVLEYAVGESLVGHRVQQAATQPLHASEWAVMDAVVLTCAAADWPRARAARPRIALPDDGFGQWLASLVLAAGGAAQLESLKTNAATYPTMRTFETSAALDLSRAVVADAVCAQGTSTPLSEVRTELVHLPTDARLQHYPALRAAGYVPVGLRLHVQRADEVVLQRLSCTQMLAAHARFMRGDIQLVPALRRLAAPFFALLGAP